MCIAIAKKKGVALPNEEALVNCWNSNSDGAGFAFAFDGIVHTVKGLMTYDEFSKTLKMYDEKYNFKKLGVLLHFRITTHGGTSQEMCHPFPISADNEIIKATTAHSQYAIVHNGIMPITSAQATREKTMSDTAVFVRDYLSLIANNRQWFKKDTNIDLIENLIESKMAILSPNGEIKTTSGFHENQGILYSNYSYEPPYYNYSKYYGWDNEYLGYDIKHTYKSKKATAPTDNKIDLMLLPTDVHIDCGGWEDYSPVDKSVFSYYVDESSVLYYSPYDDEEAFRTFSPIGNCKLTDLHTFRELEFIATYTANISQLDVFNDYPTDDEGVYEMDICAWCGDKIYSNDEYEYIDGYAYCEDCAHVAMESPLVNSSTKS